MKKDRRQTGGKMAEERRRVSLVTGSGSGIGRAVAVEEARRGHDVILHYGHNIRGAEETEKRIRELCPETKTLLVGADVSSEEEVKAMLKEAEQSFPVIDNLINNAGVTKDNLILRMSTEDFDEVISANLRGVFLLCKYLSRKMLKNHYGRIVNISSVTGVHGNAGQANYAASKAGIIGLSKSLAKEFAPREVTVNVVAPGFIETRMTEVLPEEVKAKMLSEIPLGRYGRPEDVAQAVSFFTEERTSYVTGQVILVDGGMGM